MLGHVEGTENPLVVPDFAQSLARHMLDTPAHQKTADIAPMFLGCAKLWNVPNPCQALEFADYPFSQHIKVSRPSEGYRQAGPSRVDVWSSVAGWTLGRDGGTERGAAQMSLLFLSN